MGAESKLEKNKNKIQILNMTTENVYVMMKIVTCRSRQKKHKTKNLKNSVVLKKQWKTKHLTRCISLKMELQTYYDLDYLLL